MSEILPDNDEQLDEFGFVFFRHDFLLIQGLTWNLRKLAFPSKMSLTPWGVTSPPYFDIGRGNDMDADG